MSVIVKATPEFRPEASRTGLYVFSYHIRIENHTSDTLQLLTRHWKIQDGERQTIQVDGEGVVGLQPVIQPGKHFEYSSWVQIEHVPGVMQGHYFCLTGEGVSLRVEIPAFVLKLPGTLLN